MRIFIFSYSYIQPTLLCAFVGFMLAGCGGGSSDADGAANTKPKLVISYAQDGSNGLDPEIALKGVLPPSAAKKPLLDAIRGSFPYPVKVNDQVVRKAGVAPAPWHTPLLSALPGLLNKASSLTLTFDDRSLEVDSISENDADKDAIARDTVLAFSNSIHYVNHRLKVEKIKPRPSQLSITMDDSGKIQLRGLLPDEATRTSIEALLSKETWHGDNVSISNKIEVRPFAEHPLWAAELRSFLMMYFDTPQNRNLYIDSDSVRLGGQVRSDQEKRILVYAAGRAFVGSDLPVADTLAINRLSNDQRRQILSRQSLKDFVAPIHIYFESGHHTPAKGELHKLQAVAAKLAITETDERLEIVGMTDDKGDEGVNDWIKNERCKAVRDALIEIGCDGSRLLVRPDAPSPAPNPNDTAEKLRRVEFRVVASPQEETEA